MGTLSKALGEFTAALNTRTQTSYDEQLKGDKITFASQNLILALTDRSGWDDRDRLAHEVLQALGTPVAAGEPRTYGQPTPGWVNDPNNPNR